MTKPAAQSNADTVVRSGLTVILGIALIVRLTFLLTINPTYEDAFITYRYAENIALGHGFVYNLGEYVQGTTTPLFTLILAAFAKLGLDVRTFSRLLTLLCDIGTCYVIFALLKSRRQIVAGLLAASIYAIAPPNINWSISGMETSMVILLGTGCFLTYLLKRLNLLALLAGLLLLTRIDGAILLAILAIFVLYEKRTIPWRPLLLFLILTLPWFVFAWWYFGSPLPQSMAAKQAVYSATAADNLKYIYGLWLTGMSGKLTFLLFLIGCVEVVIHQRWAAPLIIYYLLYCMLFAFSGTRIFRWYIMPPTPAYYAVAMLGLVALAVEVDNRALSFLRRIHRQQAYYPLRVMVVIAAAFFFSAVSIRTVIQRHSINSRGQQLYNVANFTVGQWLYHNTAQDATVALEPIGYIGYYSKRYIIDLVGLVSPQVVPLRLKDTKHPYATAIFELEPDYCVLRNAEYDANFGSEPTYQEKFDARYQRVYQAGELVIYRHHSQEKK